MIALAKKVFLKNDEKLLSFEGLDVGDLVERPSDASNSEDSHSTSLLFYRECKVSIIAHLDTCSGESCTVFILINFFLSHGDISGDEVLPDKIFVGCTLAHLKESGAYKGPLFLFLDFNALLNFCKKVEYDTTTSETLLNNVELPEINDEIVKVLTVEDLNDMNAYRFTYFGNAEDFTSADSEAFKFIYFYLRLSKRIFEHQELLDDLEVMLGGPNLLLSFVQEFLPPVKVAKVPFLDEEEEKDEEEVINDVGEKDDKSSLQADQEHTKESTDISFFKKV